MATDIAFYEIHDGGKLTITNVVDPTLIKGEGDDKYFRELIVRGTDGKIETPDAGRITKFGPVQYDKEGEGAEEVTIECLHIPLKLAGIKLPLYRAGAGTTVTVPVYDSTKTRETTVVITPTLSEEVVYYIEACKKLGLTCTYNYD